jgi:hypothetical protein
MLFYFFSLLSFLLFIKVVLSACSPYFRKLLKANPCEHPIVILRDIRSEDVENLLRCVLMKMDIKWINRSQIICGNNSSHTAHKKNENINVAILASITFSEVKIKIKKFHCMWKKIIIIAKRKNIHFSMLFCVWHFVVVSYWLYKKKCVFIYRGLLSICL